MSCSQQLRIGQRHQGLGGVDHRAAVHLLHQVAEPAAGAAVVDRVAHVVLAHQDRIEIRRQLLDFALAQRRQRGGIGGLGLDQRLLDHFQRLLRRVDGDEPARLALAEVQLLGRGGQRRSQARRIVHNRLVQQRG